eukprot:EC787234.1.p3 GENE.EC787234.1~~EC787234.1.p3  ORF type:complete len:58 (-),score=0.63 EC787234.1:149-322(-)
MDGWKWRAAAATEGLPTLTGLTLVGNGRGPDSPRLQNLLHNKQKKKNTETPHSTKHT